MLDKSGRGQHTTLNDTVVRCPTKTEGYMYNIQYNTPTVQINNRYTTLVQQSTTHNQYNNTASRDTTIDTKRRHKRQKRAKIHTEL